MNSYTFAINYYKMIAYKQWWTFCNSDTGDFTLHSIKHEICQINLDTLRQKNTYPKTRKFV